ncbi:hypothetical protein BGZ98_005281 [Dissophora globulifera]|nr:hypothetical protein BGZ98_005281 [Dissophora globulifera]
MTSHVLFRAKNIGKKTEEGEWLFRNIDLELDNGVLTITGPSGVGKSTLLKCINQTITMDEGQVWLQEKTPDQWGIPAWRSKIMYIPQRAAIMEGTPLDFVDEVRKFGVHKTKNSVDDPVQIALDWGIRPDLWHSRWGNLSGGEIQRIALAIGCSFRPEILLLDEPTSALDEESCSKVEKTLRTLNCIWVTHSPAQAKRISTVGTFVMQGGDNSEPQSPSQVVVEDDSVHGQASGNKHNYGSGETRSSTKSTHTTTSVTNSSSSSKNTNIAGH